MSLLPQVPQHRVLVLGLLEWAGGCADAQLAALQALGDAAGASLRRVSRGTPPKPFHWPQTVSHPSPPHEPVSLQPVWVVSDLCICVTTVFVYLPHHVNNKHMTSTFLPRPQHLVFISSA